MRLLQHLLNLGKKVRPRNEQGGQLIVLGRDKVHIKLNDYPYRVDVFFKKKDAPPPCDPHHHKHKQDRVEWHIERVCHRHGHQYVLHIEWHVHELREIVWQAYY